MRLPAGCGRVGSRTGSRASFAFTCSTDSRTALRTDRPSLAVTSTLYTVGVAAVTTSLYSPVATGSSSGWCTMTVRPMERAVHSDTCAGGVQPTGTSAATPPAPPPDSTRYRLAPKRPAT